MTAQTALPISLLFVGNRTLGAVILPRRSIMAPNETNSQGDVTVLLQRFARGDRGVHSALLPKVYLELHKIASARLRSERGGHTLQPTELVNEVYLKLENRKDISFANRGEFFALSSMVMRHFLTDYARSKSAKKRSSGGTVPLDEAIVFTEENTTLTLEIDDLLDRLAATKPRWAQVVEMRFFGGLTEGEIGESLGMCARNVRRDWEKARAWLLKEMDRAN